MISLSVSTSDYHTAGEPPADRTFLRQRNVTVFADGQVDRSPCGSGTCARLAVLAVVPRVTGLAHRTEEHTSVVDPADPLVPGFVLR